MYVGLTHYTPSGDITTSWQSFDGNVGQNTTQDHRGLQIAPYSAWAACGLLHITSSYSFKCLLDYCNYIYNLLVKSRHVITMIGPFLQLLLSNSFGSLRTWGWYLKSPKSFWAFFRCQVLSHQTSLSFCILKEQFF